MQDKWQAVHLLLRSLGFFVTYLILAADWLIELNSNWMRTANSRSRCQVGTKKPEC